MEQKVDLMFWSNSCSLIKNILFNLLNKINNYLNFIITLPFFSAINIIPVQLNLLWLVYP